MKGDPYIKVLLIDAVETEAKRLQDLLASEKNLIFQTQVASDVAAAIALSKKDIPEVVLVNLSSKVRPEEVLSRVNKSELAKLPVIVIAEAEHEMSAAEAVMHGAKDYLLKGQMDARLLCRVIYYVVAQKRTEDSLKRSEERFRIMIENSSDIITLLGPDGTVIYESPSVEKTFGYRQQELVGKNIYEYVHPEDRLRVTQEFSAAIQNRVLNQRVQFRFRHKSGEWRFIEAIGSTALDESQGLIAVVNSRDVTDRVELEEKLLSMSLDDSLTGLLNRRGFLTLGSQQLKQARREKQPILLLFGDLDGLKNINDTYGHSEGDAALLDVSNILRQTFREPDIIARLGGDEFAVLAIGAAEANALSITVRLQARLDERNVRTRKPYPLQMSIGVVHFDPRLPCSIEDLLSRADIIMYQQKKIKK